MVLYSTEKRAQAAVRDVKLGMPVRAASRKWTIPRSYLQRRLEGIPTRKEVSRDQQALSPLLEKQLVTWAVGQARLGYAPSVIKFKHMAQRLLNASGTSYSLATVVNINIFFDRLDAPELKHIPADRYYNTDEMGIGQGVGADHWVIADASSRTALKKDVERGEWITALEVWMYRASGFPMKTWSGGLIGGFAHRLKDGPAILRPSTG
ncbi:hypothetical protein F4861DRAFT_532993 [Xylaria intraflava]|nr:hypothetical protein F4861DRAFT_532993 [Xylaria intraflava]